MATRASWSGYLKVSLLSVPVKAYSATTGDAGKISLRQLHADCWQRINQQTICPVHGPIPRDEIASGYEAADGEYVVLSDEELKLLECDEERNIDIEAFVPAGEIDPVYFTEKTWYLTPNGPAGQRMFGLLQQGLQSEARCAIGRAVINRRQQPVLVRAIGRLVGVTVLRYDHQVTRADAFNEMVTDSAVSEEEKQLFMKLIQSLSQSDFDLSVFRDEHTERLTRLIESKSANRIGPAKVPEEQSTPDNQLMLLLQRTLTQVAVGGSDATSGMAAETAEPITRSNESQRLKRLG